MSGRVTNSYHAYLWMFPDSSGLLTHAIYMALPYTILLDVPRQHLWRASFSAYKRANISLSKITFLYIILLLIHTIVCRKIWKVKLLYKAITSQNPKQTPSLDFPV